MKRIESCTHPLVKHCVKLRNCASFRREQASVILEGDNVIRDLLALLPAKLLFIEEGSPILPLKAEEVYIVPRYIIQKMSSVAHPQSMLALMPLPQPRPLSSCTALLALDSVQDPGNVGTMMRTSLALGFDGLFFIDACCDPCNDKALRAAKGASFLLPFQQGSRADFETFIAKAGFQLFVADLSGQDLASVNPQPKIALLVGNEGQGLSLPTQCPYTALRIPMHSAMESLNVAQAAAIIMYVLRHKR